jgi:hypothetical protein
VGRTAAADAFASGLERSTTQAVADHLGVARAVVRRWASGEAPVALGDVMACPPSVALDCLDMAAGAVPRAVLPCRLPLDRQLLGLVAQATQLLELVAEPSSLTDEALRNVVELLDRLATRIEQARTTALAEIARRIRR